MNCIVTKDFESDIKVDIGSRKWIASFDSLAFFLARFCLLAMPSLRSHRRRWYHQFYICEMISANSDVCGELICVMAELVPERYRNVLMSFPLRLIHKPTKLKETPSERQA